MRIKPYENEIVIYPFADETTSPERLHVLGKITVCVIPENRSGSHQIAGDVCFDVPFSAADRRTWDKVQGGMEIALKLGDLVRGGTSAKDALRQVSFGPEIKMLAQVYRAIQVANAAGRILMYVGGAAFLGGSTDELVAATVDYVRHQTMEGDDESRRS